MYLGHPVTVFGRGVANMTYNTDNNNGCHDYVPQRSLSSYARGIWEKIASFYILQLYWAQVYLDHPVHDRSRISIDCLTWASHLRRSVTV